MRQRKDGAVKKEVSKCETADINETPNTNRMFGRLMKFHDICLRRALA